MVKHSWESKLAFSRGRAANTHPDTIRSLIPGCERVDQTSVKLDRCGVDYVATLKSGVALNIDMKARVPGCSGYWRRGPELALELWSVRPTNGYHGKIGWTLDDAKLTDYTLHVFDPQDTDDVFLLPFQLLRMAFSNRVLEWESLFKVSIQGTPGENGGPPWESSCMFVPASVVIDAIVCEMKQTYAVA